MPDITIRQMFEAGVHFGHQTRFWNPQMAPYLFGQRNKIHIIDLDKTLPMLRKALAFLQASAAAGKVILFVATKKTAQDFTKKYAAQCDMPYVNHRWLGGTLTNFKTIRQSIRTFENLKEEKEKTRFFGLTKKQKLIKERELEKLERTLGGLQHMPRLPDILFVIDVRYESIAVKEATKLGLPIAAVVDSNSSTDNIDYVIPGNDDSMRAIELYVSAVSEVIAKGLEQRREARSEEIAVKDEAVSEKAEVKVKKKAADKTEDKTQAESTAKKER